MVAPQKIKPGIAGILIGIFLMLAGLGGCIAGPVVAAIDLVRQIDESPVTDRVTVPDSFEFTASEQTSGVIVGFGPGGSNPARIGVELINADGETIPLDTVSEFDTGDGNEAIAFLGSFEDVPAGDYTLLTEGDADAGFEVLVIDFDITGMATTMLWSFGLGTLALIIGFIVLVVTLVRRSSAKKAMRAAQYLPPPGGPGYGGPDYGAPPVPPVPPAPQNFGIPTTPQDFGTPPPPPFGTPEPPQAPAAPAQNPQAWGAPPAPPAPPTAPPAPWDQGNAGNDVPPPPWGNQ